MALTVDQLAIPVLGFTAVYLSQSASPRARRWSGIVGLASQPFWFYATIHAHQWGIVASTGLYTLAWARGVYNNWVKPHASNRQ